MLCCCLLVFFFKQKTAYEMRISDWSSDVCSSDLLFRVANLGRVAVTLALSPADAGKVRPGSQIEILAGDRRSVARVDFVSPILDETTRLASVIAVIDNRAGQWRVGEPVTAAIHLAGSGPASLLVPQTAVPPVPGTSQGFVRPDHCFQATPVTT